MTYKNKPTTDIITFRAGKLKKDLVAASEREQITVSELLKRLVKNYLEQTEQKTPEDANPLVEKIWGALADNDSFDTDEMITEIRGRQTKAMTRKLDFDD